MSCLEAWSLSCCGDFGGVAFSVLLCFMRQQCMMQFRCQLAVHFVVFIFTKPHTQSPSSTRLFLAVRAGCMPCIFGPEWNTGSHVNANFKSQELERSNGFVWTRVDKRLQQKLRQVLQWYSVHRSPVDPERWLVRRRDWALCGRITCWSCRINFLRYSIQLWVVNAAWEWLILLVYLLYLARMHENLWLLYADWSENCCHVTSVLQIQLYILMHKTSSQLSSPNFIPFQVLIPNSHSQTPFPTLILPSMILTLIPKPTYDVYMLPPGTIRHCGSGWRSRDCMMARCICLASPSSMMSGNLRPSFNPGRWEERTVESATNHVTFILLGCKFLSIVYTGVEFGGEERGTEAEEERGRGWWSGGGERREGEEEGRMESRRVGEEEGGRRRVGGVRKERKTRKRKVE